MNYASFITEPKFSDLQRMNNVRNLRSTSTNMYRISKRRALMTGYGARHHQYH